MESAQEQDNSEEVQEYSAHRPPGMPGCCLESGES